MRNAERFGHRLESTLSGAGSQETGAPAASPVIQRAKDKTTLERMRRANQRATKRFAAREIKKPTYKHKFARRASSSLQNFETNKSKTALSTPFGPVNLSKFNTKDPGAKITTVAKDYGKKSVGHKYDHLVEAFGDKDSEVASDLLTGISSDSPGGTGITTDLQKNAAAKMLSISHISEERRFGGSAKMHRAILRMVKDKKVKMKDAFTGSNPLFPMAKNPNQMRRLINVEKKKLRKPPPKPSHFDEVGGYMSESSDDEN